MKLRILFAAVFCWISLASAQTFQDFLSRVNAVPEGERGAIVDSFITAVGIFPCIEFDTTVHYVYRGAANSVTVPGDANNWDPASFPMTRITGTDFWYYTRNFESDARLDYKFVTNGTNWILDPRNPYTCSGGYGPNSELRMPDWVSPPEIRTYPEIPHGTLRDTVLFSSDLNNSRTIRVYLPPGYDQSSDRYPIILFHDGLEYITLANTDDVLDYLIAHRRIRPVIAVFVPPVNRTEEYAGNRMNQFTAFVVNDVLPWMDSRFRTLTDAESRATLGASNGGNIALWLGITHPEVFGNIAAQSSNVQTSISNRLQSDPPLTLRFYLDIGTYDIPALIPMVRNLEQILETHGYEYRYFEFHEGHSWGNWRAHIDNALEMFFPGDSAEHVSEAGVPQTYSLLWNYPNPFNSSTTIVFSLAIPQHVSLNVYNIEGRLVTSLIDSPMTAGIHQILFNAAAETSGVYFCRMKTEGESAARKMLLLK
ncbi:T9SS C-terminal target domain-containing protein [candidate division KSB1 bacterium]|nr:MAG: T9SS C-terminal target domain-containing protein [candidate division KSB1 bacterium]